MSSSMCQGMVPDWGAAWTGVSPGCKSEEGAGFWNYAVF